MTPPGRGWNEAKPLRAPRPFEQLSRLGYTYVAAETLEAERESLKEVVLTKRLAEAARRS